MPHCWGTSPALRVIIVNYCREAAVVMLIISHICAAYSTLWVDFVKIFLFSVHVILAKPFISVPPSQLRELRLWKAKKCDRHHTVNKKWSQVLPTSRPVLIRWRKCAYVAWSTTQPWLKTKHKESIWWWNQDPHHSWMPYTPVSTLNPQILLPLWLL